MSYKSIVLASAVALALPGLAQALSMSCDDPGRRPSGAPYPSSAIRGRDIDFPHYRRPAVPDWVRERRSRPFEAPRFRAGFRDRIGERPGYRARPRRPEPPAWVQARRAARPYHGYAAPAFGDPGAAPATDASTAENRYPEDRYRPGGPGRWSGPGCGGPERFAGRRGPGWHPVWSDPGWRQRYGHAPGAGEKPEADDAGCRRDRRGLARPLRIAYAYPPAWPMPPRAAPSTPAGAAREAAQAEPTEPAETTGAPDAQATEPAADQPTQVAAMSATAAGPAVPTDTDADGILDMTDLCPDSATGAAVDAFGCAADTAIVLRGVNFKPDSAELTEESLSILDGVSKTLLANPAVEVEVAGHTDSDADPGYNLDLSQRRAESVVAYLVGKGVPVEKMTAKGYGEQRPIAGNETAEGKARNRRVELNRL